MMGEKMDNLQEQNNPMMTSDDEIEIDLKEIFLVLLNNWRTIFLVMLVGTVISGTFHFFCVTPLYEAKADLYIANTDSTVTYSDIQLSNALTDDYAQIIKSRTVLKKVIQELELDLDYKTLGKMVDVSNPDATHFVEIRVTSDDLEMSKNIVNKLVTISADHIYQVIKSSAPTVVDYAEADTVEDVTPGILKYLVLGAFFAAALTCFVLVLRMLLNTTLKTEEDIQKYLNLPVLSAVPYYRERA